MKRFLEALKNRARMQSAASHSIRYRAPSVQSASTERSYSGKTIPGRRALELARRNEFRSWNRSTCSAELSNFATDASRRILDGLAAVIPIYSGPKLKRDSKIFAMGSCFAREIESAIIAKGGDIISVDDSIDRNEFRDPSGKIRNGFFHRFTPRAMSQEFQSCFGDLSGWSDDTLIFPLGNHKFIDLNYWQVEGADESRGAIELRRSVAKELVRRAAEADVVILTLGLTEAWFHKPTGFFANYTTPQFLARHRSDFELHLIGVNETIDCLQTINETLEKHHRTGSYELVVTVSPVPLSATFTDKDVIVANMDSKSTLRAAAAEFVANNDHAHYFPSYEMALYSDPDLTWRPDRIHVNGRLVKHIVSTFMNAYYRDGAFEDS